MKNTMRKGFLLMAMLAVVLAVGLAFVSCDTMGGGGSALDGDWSSNGNSGLYIRINGSTGTFTSIPSSGNWRNAANRGDIRVGSPKFRNLRRTGNYEWTGESIAVSSSTASWHSTTITLASNGRTFSLYTPGATGAPTDTYTRR